jgi:hypothetical protein
VSNSTRILLTAFFRSLGVFSLNLPLFWMCIAIQGPRASRRLNDPCWSWSRGSWPCPTRGSIP